MAVFEIYILHMPCTLSNMPTSLGNMGLFIHVEIKRKYRDILIIGGNFLGGRYLKVVRVCQGEGKGYNNL